MSETKVAIVTGGVQGIGVSIAKSFLNKRYRVVVADIRDDLGKQFVKEEETAYGVSKILYFHCDVSKLDDFKSLFEFTLKELGRVDVLVNNAGIASEKNYQLLLNTNLMGPINGTLTALQYMGKSKGGNGGAVVNIASLGGLITHPGYPAYCASKHGVVGLTRGYGHPFYLEKEGLIFCALCPDAVRTNIGKNSNFVLADPDIKLRQYDKILEPDDVAEGVMKLLEDKINGSVAVLTVEKELFYVG